MPEFLWKWRKEILFSLLIVISFTLLVSRHKPHFFSDSLRQGISFLLVPVQKLSDGAAVRAREALGFLAAFGALERENRALRKELDALRLENARLGAGARETEELRDQLGYKQRVRWDFIPAEVVGRDPASWLERVVVNRGTADGVRPGAGVITPQGVVGRVSEVNLYSATVVLLTDSQSSVAAVVERSRVPGTVKGTGGRWLSLAHTSGEDDVKPNDLVVTSQVSSIFPPGLFVGDVVSVTPADNGLMLSVRLKPRVAFTSLDHLLIIRAQAERRP